MGVRLPLIDDVEYWGVAKLKHAPARDFRALRRPVIVTGPHPDNSAQRDDLPIAVIVPYETYLQAQGIIVEALKLLQGAGAAQCLGEALERAGFTPRPMLDGEDR